MAKNCSWATSKHIIDNGIMASPVGKSSASHTRDPGSNLCLGLTLFTPVHEWEGKRLPAVKVILHQLAWHTSAQWFSIKNIYIYIIDPYQQWLNVSKFYCWFIWITEWTWHQLHPAICIEFVWELIKLRLYWCCPQCPFYMFFLYMLDYQI